MDSTRTTFALGPLEISFRRREDSVRAGILLSVVLHVLAVLLLTFAVPHHGARATVEAAQASPPPVPITFVSPIPPQPRQRQEEIATRRPPAPAQPKPLRMQPVPESNDALSAVRPAPHKQAGQKDTRPAGGEAGGPKAALSPGVPPPATSGRDQEADKTVASNLSESKDILGRLQDFKRAVEAPHPSTSHGPQGGGHGSGGVTMPNLPATGFGVGNLEFEGRDYDWESYGRQIHGIIWRAWHNRLLITASVFERWAAENRSWMLDHQNAVRFTILRSGQVVDVAVESGSGCYPLDDSATDALKEVVLPPLPADFPRDTETVHARFIAEGEIRTMKTFLQQMKNAGFF